MEPRADLFDWTPPPAPPPAEPKVARSWPTDADCRRMERALERFQHWFLSASAEDIAAAKPAALATKYPPIEASDIAQMMEVRLATLRRKAAR